MNQRHRAPSRSLPAIALAMLLGGTLADALAQAPMADEAAALGRLFLSPDQRRALDHQRGQLRLPANTLDHRDLLPSRAAADRRVVLNGVVRRAAGAPLVWLNGRPVPPTAMAEAGVRLRDGPDAEERVTVESGADGASARLKPGQAWDPATGEVTDCLGCGAPESPPDGVVPAEPAAAGASDEVTALSVADATTPPVSPPSAAQSP